MDDEAKAATVQEAGKTLVVYYSYTNNCHEIVTSLTSQIQADVMRIEPADKTMVSTNRPQKYEANGYAIGTALLNAIKAVPNDAALRLHLHAHLQPHRPPLVGRLAAAPPHPRPQQRRHRQVRTLSPAGV